MRGDWGFKPMAKDKFKLAVLESKYSGAVTGVNDLVVRLDKERFEAIFIYLSGDPACENHLEKGGYRVCYLSTGKRMDIFRPAVLLKLVSVLRKNRIELLHCHAHKATQYGAIAGFFLRHLKIIAHVHGLGRSARLRRKSANYFFLNRIDRFLTVAASVKEDLIQSNWRIPASKVTVLENSVDYDRFAHVNITKEQIRRSLNAPPDAFIFGAVGRLAPTKGISYLIDAFSLVKKEFSQAYLLLVGQGPEEQQYSRQVQKLGLQDSVCFAGFRRDIEKVFRALDVFVISSVAEGMPRVLLEAKAAGIPCIGTRVGGIPAVLNDSVGLLVEAQNCEALADAMKAMMRKNPEELGRLRTSAEQRARDLYSHAVVSEKLKNVYLEILGQMAPSVSPPESPAGANMTN
jgi:glycosyltransferase involved in cell wall biosynthesis